MNMPDVAMVSVDPVNLLSIGMLILLLWLLIQQRILRHLRAESARMHSAQGELRRDLTALIEGTVDVGERMILLERLVRWVDQRQGRLEMHDSDDRPYAAAIRMAQSGVAADDIAAACQLTPVEVKLLLMLHRSEGAQSDVRPSSTQ